MVFMPVDRISLALEAEIGAAVREEAERAGLSVSAWISKAVADRIRNARLRAALKAWEEEDGPLTEEELDEAREALGFPRKHPRPGP